MKLVSTQFSASPSSCLLRRNGFSFNFKIDTEVAGIEYKRVTWWWGYDFFLIKKVL